MKKILLAIDQPLLVNGIYGLLKTGSQSLDIHVSTTDISMLEMLKCNEYQLIIIKLSTVSPSLVMQISKLLPTPSILALADGFDATNFYELYKSGASGVFNLHDGIGELSFAIDQTLDKNIYMANCFKHSLLNSAIAVPATVAFKQLTKRESEIAKLMLNGKKMCEISSLLDLRASTVTTFKSKIYTKLGVTNLLELDQVIKKHQN